MNFYIKKDSTMPYLVMEFEASTYKPFVEKEFYKRLQNSSITFSLIDSEKCKYLLKCAPAELFEYEDCIDKDCASKFFLVYKFSKKDTKKIGQYKGEFKITFNDNQDVLQLPIKRELKINII